MTEQRATDPATTPGPHHRRSPWPYAIVGFFVVQSVVLATTMVLASRLPANAEPGYYEKALAWNEIAEAGARPRQQGWVWKAGGHDRLVSLTLTGAEGEPIIAASVTAVAFHRASALDRHSLTFVETAPGVYRGTLPEARAGLWEVRFTVDNAGEPSLITETVEMR